MTTHPTKEESHRALGGGRAEVERMVAHLAVCPSCRAVAVGILRDRSATGKRAKLVKAMDELATFERALALDRLLAKAELADLRRLTRGAQRERVMLSRSCHSAAFVDALLGALRSPRSGTEAESLSNLALLAAHGMDPTEGSESFKNDLLALIWIESANARRIRGEWQQARAALVRAEERREAGTGNPCVKARWLSIEGSLQFDQGKRYEAMASLEQCRRTYTDQSEWQLLGQTLVQMAHCTTDDEPECALTFLDRASIYVSADDTGLRSLAARIRTDCLVTLGRLEDALYAFAEAERLRPEYGRPSAALRSTFIAARLLEALGHAESAEALFDAVVADDLEQGFFKDAVLDLVYFLGFYLRLGSPERAASLGLRTLGELDRHDSGANDQLRSVLTQLIEAARGQCLDKRMLRAAREYLQVYWKHPAPSEPVLASDGKQTSSSAYSRAVIQNRMLIEPLLASALWSRLRHQKRREQQSWVARSSEFHTLAFVELLLAGICRAPSRDDAEFMASLALQALEHVDDPAIRKHDLQTQLWTEIANVRRVASEWKKAGAALLQAAKHLAAGSGDRILKARMQSVAASLSSDQGHRAEAIAALEECLQLYESQGAWPLVARTLVQMAHTLVDTEPARALALVNQALPMISTSDATLRCLAENIRIDGLMNLGEFDQALQTFHQAERLRGFHASPVARRRCDFLAARLLEVHGHSREAVQLFESVIADSFEQEAYREAFLDLLYLFGLHIRQGATERAVAVCRLAIDRLDLFNLGHEQLRVVWMELMDAAGRRVVALDTLPEVRRFLEIHWKKPAAKAPSFSFRRKR
jgi:tetratricopeptide (TPR) repeat protein